MIAWIVSVSFIEEVLFRGFLQSIFVKRFAKNRATLIFSILAASLVFGLTHLVQYDLGFYGELAQIFYAFFIAFLFGAIILITRKIWPVIVLHTLINITAVLYTFSSEYTLVNDKTYETPIQFFWEQTLLFLPCFIYGFYLLWNLKEKELRDILSLKE